jgi:hypothetical protein
VKEKKSRSEGIGTLATERRLAASTARLKPGAPVIAIEMGRGDPEVQEVIRALSQGNTISTPVNPTAPVPFRPIRNDDMKNVAVTLYTSANGLSRVISSRPGGYSLSASTGLTVEVADYLTQGGITERSG